MVIFQWWSAGHQTGNNERLPVADIKYLQSLAGQLVTCRVNSSCDPSLALTALPTGRTGAAPPMTTHDDDAPSGFSVRRVGEHVRSTPRPPFEPSVNARRLSVQLELVALTDSDPFPLNEHLGRRPTR